YKRKGDFMNENNKEQLEAMEIDWKQQKAISSPLRSKMIALLYEKPMTPKQTADMLGKNPGTVYYHIQQLVKHDILEVESIRTEKGIVEKFYRAKAILFRNPEQTPPLGQIDSGQSNIYMSKKLTAQLSKDLQNLFYKYGKLSYEESGHVEQDSYRIEYL